MKIFYISGFPRSGTTFTASILSRQKSTLALPESQFRARHYFKTWNGSITSYRKLLKDFRFRIWSQDQSLPYEVVNQSKPDTLYLDLIRHYYPGFDTYIDHTPSNIFIADFTSKPSNHLFVLRNPLLIYSSHKKLKWGHNNPYTFHNEYCKYMSVAFTSHLARHISCLWFESFAKNPSFLFNHIYGHLPEINNFPNIIVPKHTQEQHSNLHSFNPRSMLNPTNLSRREADHLSTLLDGGNIPAMFRLYYKVSSLTKSIVRRRLYGKKN